MLLGCGVGNNVKLTPVKGTVKIDGKPAAGILVQLMPDISKQSAGPTSQAISNDAGELTFSTVDGKSGAAVGNHVVIFADALEERPPQGQEVTKPSRIPSRYTTAAGGLSVTVEPNKDLTLEIKTTN